MSEYNNLDKEVDKIYEFIHSKGKRGIPKVRKNVQIICGSSRGD